MDYKKINQTSFYVKRKITYTEIIVFSLLYIFSFIWLAIVLKNFINFFKISLIFGIVTIILTLLVLVFLISKVYVLSSIGFRDESETYEIKLDKNTKINDVIRKIANDKDKVGTLNEDKLEILTKLGFREE